MSRTVSANLITEGQKQHNALPWLWLYEIELDKTVINRTVARLVNYDSEISWQSNTYYPYQITHDEIAQDTEGNLPQLSLTMANASRAYVRWLEVSQGMANLLVTISLVHLAHIGTGDGLSQTFQIRGGAATDEAISLNLEMPNFYQLPIPKDIYMRNRCRVGFKSTQCGYVGLNTHCTKALLGDDGCKFHGDDERTNKRPVLHPRNYGGFAAIPRRVR